MLRRRPYRLLDRTALRLRFVAVVDNFLVPLQPLRKMLATGRALGLKPAPTLFGNKVVTI